VLRRALEDQELRKLTEKNAWRCRLISRKAITGERATNRWRAGSPEIQVMKTMAFVQNDELYVLTPLAKRIFLISVLYRDDSEAPPTASNDDLRRLCILAEAPMRGHTRPDFTNRSLRF